MDWGPYAKVVKVGIVLRMWETSTKKDYATPATLLLSESRTKEHHQNTYPKQHICPPFMITVKTVFMSKEKNMKHAVIIIHY